MKLPQIIPPADILQQFEGVEAGLRQRRRLGGIGWIGLIISGTLQAAVAIVNSDYGQALMEVDLRKLWAQFGSWWPYLLLLLLPLLFLSIASWARFWLNESKDSFRYTCSIADFQSVVGTEKNETLAWLSHDLAERLNERVKRLRFKDEKDLSTDKAETGESHVHIRGFYGVRNDRQGIRTIEMAPRIRIGPTRSPETLAHPVVLGLKAGNGGQQAKEPEPELLNLLGSQDYERVIERVYFSIATELYKQIQHDVENKIGLLPGAYFRAVALFHEAEDYAGSNTLDAYTEAQKLYERAIHYFDPSLRPLSAFVAVRLVQRFMRWGANIRRLTIRSFSYLWPRLGHVEVMCARAEIGYANMLLYRRILAALSGRRLNPMYEARPVAERAVKRLESLRVEVAGRSDTLFNGYVTLALAWSHLGSPKKAEEALCRAQCLDPNRCGEDARYFFVRGEVEPHTRAALQDYQRAVELEPRFEIAQSAFAYRAEGLWRSRPMLERNVAEMVLNEYEQVYKINPGNIAVWANCGNMRWLLGEEDDLRIAKEDFESGREYKAIKRATFVAELDQGLARIEAERGDFKEAYRSYVNAVSAVIGQGASHGSTYADFFSFQSDALLDRFVRYLRKVEWHYDRWKDYDYPVRAFREIVRQLGDLRDTSDQTTVDNAVKQLIKLLNLLSDPKSFSKAHKDELQAWVERQSDKSRVRQWLPKGDLAHFATQVEKTSTQKKDRDIFFGEALRIVLDSGFRALIEHYLDAAATQRVRDSVLAFAHNDYGEACHYYYLCVGDETKRDEAKEAFVEAIRLNPNYVIPHYNLYLFHRPRDCNPSDIIEAKKHLDAVCQYEPNWAHVKLAQAELKAILAMKACLPKAPKELHDLACSLGGAERLNREATRLIQQVLPHNWLWTEQKNGMRDFEWKTLLPKFKYQIRWQKELDDLHVRALFVLGCVKALPLTSQEESTPMLQEDRVLPLNVRKLFCHLQQNYMPAEINLHEEFRELLGTVKINGLFKSKNYSELVEDQRYLALIRDEKLLGHLQANRRLRLLLKRQYWEICLRKNFRGILRDKGYGDLVLYHECSKIFRSSIERSIFQLQAPFWALSWVVVDMAFAEEVKSLFSEGDGFKSIDAILKQNRSRFFDKWHGDQLWKKGKTEAALEAYRLAKDTEYPQLLISLAKVFQELGHLDESLELFQQARKDHAAQGGSISYARDSRLGIAGILWSKNRCGEAIDELKTLEATVGNGGQPGWIKSLLSGFLEYDKSDVTVAVLKAWLEDYQQRALEEGNQELMNEVKDTLGLLSQSKRSTTASP